MQSMKARARGTRAIALPLLIAAALLAVGWGTVAHLFINTHAVDDLPASMGQFINSRTYFGAHASDADNRKGSDPNEAPKHFIDIESYPDYENLTPRIDSVLAIYGATKVLSIGTLPWATVQTYDSLVAALRRADFARADSIAADLGHYVGDGHQPLHVTVNYDGQMTGNSGVHARYETSMINTYASKLRVNIVPAVYVPNRFSFVLSYLIASNGMVDSILMADNDAKAVSAQIGTGTYDTVYYRVLWNDTRAVTTREMQDATQSLADLWYSSWVDAGLITTAGTMLAGGPGGTGFALAQNYPNPFNPSTTISYTLAQPGHVSLTVWSIAGSRVATLVDAAQPAGKHEARFAPAAMASGVYFYRLRQGELVRTGKMLYVR